MNLQLTNIKYPPKGIQYHFFPSKTELMLNIRFLAQILIQLQIWKIESNCLSAIHLQLSTHSILFFLFIAAINTTVDESYIQAFSIVDFKVNQFHSSLSLFSLETNQTMTALYRYLLSFSISLYVRLSSFSFCLSVCVPVSTQCNCNPHISSVSSSLTELPSWLIAIHYLYLYSSFSASVDSFHFYLKPRMSHWKSFFSLNSITFP